MLPYIKLFADLHETVEEMTADEAGRLFKALLAYANGKPVQLEGAERYVFLMLKAQIDRDSEAYADKCQKMSANGKKAGHGKQLPTIAGNCTQDKEKEKEEDKDKEEDKESTAPSLSPTERDELTVYIAESITPMNADVLDTILSFREQLGDELVKEAVRQTVENGTRHAAYCKAILNRWIDAGYKRMADIKPDATGKKQIITRSVIDEPEDGFYSELMNRPRGAPARQ